MSCLSLSRIDILRDRAEMLALSRQFFAERGVVEVDTPLLSASASIDTHIDLMPVCYANSEERFLLSSPEYHMKRLLVEGMGDIYQLSHVFRDNEFGRFHRPEFMMTEWYRLGFSLEAMMQETISYLSLFLGNCGLVAFSYREALKQFAGIDYLNSSEAALVAALLQHGVTPSPAISDDREALLSLILSSVVEPKFVGRSYYLLFDFPANQAALSQTLWRGDEEVAERFEIYFDGTELANGYHELGDAIEQEKRLHEANQKRRLLGKRELPLDYPFIQALEKGFPDCCGVAVGFDRLMMLRHKLQEIGEALP